MKKIPFLSLLWLIASLAIIPDVWGARKKEVPRSGVESIALSGYVGQRIDDCITHRIMGQNADELIAPFRQQTETRGLWASEF